jgi:hypothetical protein
VQLGFQVHCMGILWIIMGPSKLGLGTCLSLDLKKHNSKKWWSHGEIELLFPMHLEYTSEFSGGPQTAGWLSDKAMAHKSKFETDQQNQLNELTKKRKAEEEE